MNKRKKWLLAGCIAVTGVTAVLWLKGYFEVKEPIRVLERNPPGMGDKEIQMEFQTEQGRFPVNLKLAERSYREDELETIFEQGRLWLDDVWLGENASSQTVIHDLYFPTEIETLGLAVRWETESYRWVQTDGIITDEAREMAPLDMTVRAVLSYGDKERTVDYPIRIITPEKDEKICFAGISDESAGRASV